MNIFASSPPVHDSAVATAGATGRTPGRPAATSPRLRGASRRPARRSGHRARHGIRRSVASSWRAASSADGKRALIRRETIPPVTVVPTEGLRSRRIRSAWALSRSATLLSPRPKVCSVRERMTAPPDCRADVREDVPQEHRLHFLRHAGHDEDAADGLLVAGDVGRVDAGGGAVGVLDRRRAARDHRLDAVQRGHRAVDLAEEASRCPSHFSFSSSGTRMTAASAWRVRSSSVGPMPPEMTSTSHRPTDSSIAVSIARLVVGDRQVRRDRAADGGELLADPGGVGVHRLAEDQLVADGEDDGAWHALGREVGGRARFVVGGLKVGGLGGRWSRSHCAPQTSMTNLKPPAQRPSGPLSAPSTRLITFPSRRCWAGVRSARP